MLPKTVSKVRRVLLLKLDLDFAQAVSQQASNDVLGQAALTVQAQANQQQSQVLSLLS